MPLAIVYHIVLVDLLYILYYINVLYSVNSGVLFSASTRPNVQHTVLLYKSYQGVGPKFLLEYDTRT